MSDDELEKIRRRKLESYMKLSSMPQEIVKLHNPQNYDQLITDFPEKVIIIDFSAEWCGPCKIFTPVFHKLQEEFSKDFIFATVDVDENGYLANKFQVTGVPTTIFIQNDKIIHRFVGVMNYESMKQVLNKFKSKYN